MEIVDDATEVPRDSGTGSAMVPSTGEGGQVCALAGSLTPVKAPLLLLCVKKKGIGAKVIGKELSVTVS